MKALAVGITVQLGINSGLNSQGLCSVLSYLDTQIPDCSSPAQESGWAGDNRGLANAEMLAQCSTVHEGNEFLTQYFARFPSVVGGNFILTDRYGALGIVEYYHGTVRFSQTLNTHIIRANNGLLVGLTEQQQLPEATKRDRKGRFIMADRLGFKASAGTKDEAVADIQGFLSQHGDENHPPICVHDYDVTGARYSRPEPISTVTGVIFDIRQYRMLFTRGNPCGNIWQELNPALISS